MPFHSLREDEFIKMKIVNVVNYGAMGDGTTDDTAALQAAVAAASDNIVFIPSGTYKITDDVTVPGNVALLFANGAKLSVDSGKTVAINGHIDAPPSQIFSGSGTIGGEPKNDFVRPEWWGAVADGTTSCSSAIDKATTFASSVSSKVAKVKFLPGQYVIDSALTFDNKHSIVWEGSGPVFWGITPRLAGTELVIKDIPTNTYGISMTGCKAWCLRDMKVISSGTKAKAGIYLGSSTAEFHLENVFVWGFTHASVELDTVFSLSFINCKFSGSDTGVYSISTCQNITFVGCWLTQNTYAGVMCSGQNYTFIGVDFEGQSRAIDQSYSPGGVDETANRVVSRGWVIDGCYLEAMTEATVVYLVFCRESRIGTFYNIGTNDTLLLASCNDNVVSNWKGDVTVSGASSGNVIVHATGNINDSVGGAIVIEEELADKIDEDGTVPLTADWNAGNYRISAKALNGGVKSLTFADPLACDMDEGNVFTLTTTADCTINASNGVAGQRATFIITDDATGGRVVTFGTNFKANSTLTGTANKTATVDFAYDGTNWCEVSRTTGL